MTLVLELFDMRMEHRNRLLLVVCAAMVALGMGATTPALPADAPEHSAGQPKKTQQADKKKEKGERPKAPPKPFIPSEKVSAGKSVSFPTDI
jgi:hypothetical protein